MNAVYLLFVVDQVMQCFEVPFNNFCICLFFTILDQI